VLRAVCADDVLVVTNEHEVLRIEPWGQDSVRVRAARYRIPSTSLGALDPSRPAGPPPRIHISNDAAVVMQGEITVTVSVDMSHPFPEPSVRFSNTTTGAELLAESRQHFWRPGARSYAGNRFGAYEITQQFKNYPGERLFGLGQHSHGRLDQKGLVLDLVQRNGEVNIPFVLSSNGYGLLWNVPSIGDVAFTETSTRWRASQGHEIDYWVTASPDPAAILARYADATGHCPPLPHWASGFWQSKLRYASQQELLDVAREYIRRGWPISVIVADYFHWTAMGEYRFDPEDWPDPRGMCDELRDLGIELMVSIWPTVSPLAENYDEMRAAGLLVGAAHGVEFHNAIRDKGMAAAMPVALFDATNPAAREYLWQRVKANYADLGVRVFWLDASEPEISPADPENMTFFAGPGAEVANIYPRDHARGFFDGMRRDDLAPTVLLSRSAWAGSQRFGTAVWSGDIAPTWASLAGQIRAGLNIGLSGIPWWTSDIGGFDGGDPNDVGYQELIVRWFQFGAFCPLFRLHGNREPRRPTGPAQTGGPNEIWSYGEVASNIIADLLHLREKLRPYIHQQMDQASRTGLPPMRPIFVDYPNDPAAWAVDDQMLLGPDILVAPVYEPGAASRDAYLPAGSEWIDVASNELKPGGITVRAAAPLTRIPLWVRAAGHLDVDLFTQWIGR
jgi:alpha-D-xyloside xylohydrolase